MKYKYGRCGRQRLNYRWFTAANTLIRKAFHIKVERI